jgi:hypothetical protein
MSIKWYLAQFDTLPLPKQEVTNDTIPNIISIVFAIMGGICLIIITIAGLKYTMSMGEPSATKKAKDTILYAFIGLFVSILAVTIVSLVTRELS